MLGTDSYVTLVIRNLHCPSCVDKITTLLSPYVASPSEEGRHTKIDLNPSNSIAPLVSDVSVSLLAHTVSFALTAQKKPLIKGARLLRAKIDEDHRARRKILDEIVQRLTDIGGFDIQGLVDPYPISTLGDAERAISPRLGSLARPGEALSWLTRLFSTKSCTSSQERFSRHLENCLSCQANLATKDIPVDSTPDSGADAQKGESKDSLTDLEQIREATYAVEGMTCA